MCRLPLRPVTIRVLISCVAMVALSGCEKDAGSPRATSLPPSGQLPKLSPNAPEDQPVTAHGAAEMAARRAAIAPYVEQARRTYPEARQRYLAGLPAGYAFFVVTNLRDDAG